LQALVISSIRHVPEFTPAAAMQSTNTIVTEHEAGAAISIGSGLRLRSTRQEHSYQDEETPNDEPDVTPRLPILQTSQRPFCVTFLVSRRPAEPPLCSRKAGTKRRHACPLESPEKRYSCACLWHVALSVIRFCFTSRALQASAPAAQVIFNSSKPYSLDPKVPTHASILFHRVPKPRQLLTQP